MKKFINLFSLVAVLTFPLMNGCSVARPLHRPKEKIRASLLKKTPLGTPKKDVEAFIAKEGWHPEIGVSTPPNEIEVDFGGYFIFFGTSEVFGTWKFDSNDHLIDVSVLKAHDVL